MLSGGGRAVVLWHIKSYLCVTQFISDSTKFHADFSHKNANLSKTIGRLSPKEKVI